MEARTRRPTVRDVAREASVSFSTVSNVVRGATGVSAKMRDKVTDAISRLGYRPHAAARSLRGKSFTVGIVIPDLTSPFQIEVAQGITNRLRTSAYQEVIIAAGPTAERQHRAIQELTDRLVDGLILVAPCCSSEELTGLAAVTPIVVVARHGADANFDSVVNDDCQGAHLMVEHLVGLGHVRIVHTSLPSDDPNQDFVLSHAARLLGYERSMKMHGLRGEIIATSYSERGGYDAAIRVLSESDQPSAIFAGADIAAIGVLRAADELGLAVPHDLTVTGYDNIAVAETRRISLTTVDQSGHQMGQQSARLLLERLDGRRQPSYYIIAPRLVVRRTSGLRTAKHPSLSADISDARRGSVT